jgi:hypothetical protein
MVVFECSGGMPMHLTATGNDQRRALVLILHESAKPATTIVVIGHLRVMQELSPILGHAYRGT